MSNAKYPSGTITDAQFDQYGSALAPRWLYTHAQEGADIDVMG